MFLKNAWYVAATDHELGRHLHAIKVLGEDIVLYRAQDGGVVALEDACPHRKLPLSMGRLKGDEVECGYHGLVFDCSGACTHAPGMGRPPKAAVVRSYPVAERYGLVWIWMGDPARANPADIIDVEHWGDPAWGVNQGDAMLVHCNYLYLTDNLLDPSHVSWVHQTSFGNASIIGESLKTQVNDNGVLVSRWMRNVEVAPFYAKFVKFDGRCDRKQHYEVRVPAHAVIKAIFTPAGTASDSEPFHPDVFLMDSYNFLTPVDENTTRYFWFQLRNFSPDDDTVSSQFAEDVRGAFEEDRVVLEAVHAGMARNPSKMNLPQDAGPLRFRQKMQALIQAEQMAVQTA
ncbi:aromatic ring-hydroxylating dioxygenase subunit alpha [Pollutimonas harenae]|uniref:Aromatic ring-hydroxylating dioxygenase subunit alpha n=1 Tax=Pollutimonas harenae TaxID=657015 RepID=A0A853GNX8_9BURK|nr:aromatic ring-hydroxylating dioxygenase subunit alpha [Pollutimonas harenae]NYT84728.1 aromatic ring-hydroxylating dioxygenase subunit alpha [Pollutimonas harenae]TEA72870.1 aromatic ring-hydroxylating dioxygenase subunit alpha [Pollutimonas harenae]